MCEPPEGAFALKSKLTAVATAYFAATLLLASVRIANGQEQKPSSEPARLAETETRGGFPDRSPGRAGAGNKKARTMAFLAAHGGGNASKAAGLAFAFGHDLRTLEAGTAP